jgi:hypothetical protein
MQNSDYGPNNDHIYNRDDLQDEPHFSMTLELTTIFRMTATSWETTPID